jgi:hypothetical protein
VPGVEEALEFLAVDEFHHQVGDLGLVAEVVHGDDVGVGRAADEGRLAVEALEYSAASLGSSMRLFRIVLMATLRPLSLGSVAW